MTPDRSISAATEDGPTFERRHMREGARAVRRAIQFAFAVALTGVGLWLLYRNLVHGDVVSVWIALVSAMMIGSGTLMVPTATLGRRTGDNSGLH